MRMRTYQVQFCLWMNIHRSLGRFLAQLIATPRPTRFCRILRCPSEGRGTVQFFLCGLPGPRTVPPSPFLTVGTLSSSVLRFAARRNAGSNACRKACRSVAARRPGKGGGGRGLGWGMHSSGWAAVNPLSWVGIVLRWEGVNMYSPLRSL